MAALSPEGLRQLSEQAQAFRPKQAERRPSTFLSLAPTTSTSYPQTPNQQLGPVPVNPDRTAKESRSSSLGSDSAKNTSAIGLRFLKLGPVHWGVHPSGDKGDWHDVAVE